ncbi:MAG TPA: phage tail tape measure protein [Bacteroidia bacterium]|nr:phage tail tape measure protein [Bacteroidia bacterium]
MASFTIPSIYTAIDRFTAPVRKMTGTAAEFSNKLQAGAARSERYFRKLNPLFSETSQQLFSFAKTAAIAGAIVGGIHFSVDSMKQYETAVASFRTIVGGTDKEFAPFQQAINDVARDTKKSSIDVAASFEKIAGLNATFAKTPESIKAVTNAVITLSRASGDELGPSASSLVGIMNQFSLKADQANRTINVLAAGAGVGAASIVQTAESFTTFGAVASGANITLEQSVGLVQTLGKFSLFGSEAGNQLKGTIIRLQQAGVGYKTGQFQINEALEETKKKFDKLKTAKQQDAFLTKTFGLINISSGKILLNNIEQFKQYTAGVTNTNQAQEQAAIRSATFAEKVNQMKAAFVNWITTSPEAKKAMDLIGQAAQFVGNNISTIISIGSKLVAFFLIWKAVILVSRAALIAYNIVLGINSALTGASSIAMKGNIVALAAQRIVLGTVTAAQWLWNAAMLANPIGLIIIGIAALIGYIIIVVKKWNEWGAAISIISGPIGLVISLVQSFRRNWDMITKSFKEGGILAGLKAIGATLLDAVLMPLQQILSIIAKVTGFEWAENAVKSIEGFREKIGANTTTDESGESFHKKAFSTKSGEQEALFEKLEQTNNANVNLNILDPHGRTTASSDNNLVSIKYSSTMPQP